MTYKRTAGDNGVTTYAYKNNGWLYTTTYPDSTVETLAYDGNGNLTSKVDGKSQTTTFTYDDINRLTQKEYHDSSTVVYTLDANGNVLTVDDANTDTDNEYDVLNRLTNVTDNEYTPSKVIEYTYWDDGTRKTLDGPETNDTVDYTYDMAKRLIEVELNSSTEEDIEYNALGQRVAITRGNNSVTLYNYDSTTQWLTLVNNKTSTNAVISSFAYTHDLIGNRLTMTLSGGDALDYTYDNNYRLVNEARAGGTSYVKAWTYDYAGNRLTQWDGAITTTYTYNNSNELSTEAFGITTTTYTYDDNGNQTGKADGTNTWVWTYNYENQITAYTDPVVTKNSTYLFDAMGRRIKKDIGSGILIRKIIHDGADCIASYDGSDAYQKGYVTPFLDENLLVSRTAGSSYYFQDGLGSVMNLNDSSEITQNTYEYTAFGESVSVSETFYNSFRYAGRSWDSESESYQNRERQYFPTIARFNRRDLIGYLDGINLYTYVRSNPVNLIDPWGTSWFNPLSWPGEIIEEVGKALENTGIVIIKQVGRTTQDISKVAKCPSNIVEGIITANEAKTKEGGMQFLTGVFGTIGLGSIFDEWVHPPTGGGRCPKRYAATIERTNLLIDRSAGRSGGMKNWHASSFFGMTHQAGLTELPWLWIAGVWHEVRPSDASAEYGSGDPNGQHGWVFVDSLGDIAANTLGMISGLLLPYSKKIEKSVGEVVRKLIPGPPEKGHW